MPWRFHFFDFVKVFTFDYFFPLYCKKLNKLKGGFVLKMVDYNHRFRPRLSSSVHICFFVMKTNKRKDIKIWQLQEYFPIKWYFKQALNTEDAVPTTKKCLNVLKGKKKGKLVTQNPTLNVVPRNDPMIWRPSKQSASQWNATFKIVMGTVDTTYPQ